MSQAISLNADQLQDLIAAAVRAAKEPSALEQAELDRQAKITEEKQAARLVQSKQILEADRNKAAAQRLCSHEHRNGDTHCVYIQESKGPGYLICQKNQCIIRPGVAPAGYKGKDIYDTALFNRIFQKVPGSGQEIFG